MFTPSPDYIQHFTNRDFILLGDSLIADNDWQPRMPQFTLHNLGVPGANTRDLLMSISGLKGQFSKAGIIMVMTGTNDLAVRNYSFTANLKKIVVTLSHEYPLAELLVNSLLPINLPHVGLSAIPLINDTIAEICRLTGSCYVDIFSRFQQAQGELFQEDGIHLSTHGYELWARTVLEHIAFLVEDD
jgi:lysophospholipase L1-like esterase